ADALKLALARVRVEKREQRSQVRKIEEWEPFPVGVVEDELKALLLRLVRVEDLREEPRAEVRERCADGHSGPDPAQREVLDGKARGRKGAPELGGAFLGGPSRSPGFASPETSPFTSAVKTE